MTARLVRLVVMMVRPPVAFVVFLFALIGMAQAGRAEGLEPLLVAVVLAGWFIHATVLNDLGDEAIDRVNLVGAPGRPLVSGDATRAELRRLGCAAGLVGLAGALALDRRAGLVVAAGLVLNWAYSCRPLRLCDRGMVATVILPAGYVAVPYLVGALTAGDGLRPADVGLLAALYVGFIGRIVLKDFRDVVGDARFGKRTFLLRHGRAWTCRMSAAAWVVGTAGLLAVAPRSAALVAAFAVLVGCALHGIHRLARATTHPAEQEAIQAVALVGRGVAVVLLTHLTVLDNGWAPAAGAAVIAIVAVLFAAAYAARAGVVERTPWQTGSRLPEPSVRARIPA